MTQANQMTPTPTVRRSRLRSATEDPPSELETPPPNMSERPPPRPLCRSTSRIMTALAIISTMVKSSCTVENPTSEGRRSDDRHVVEAADRPELVRLEARSAHQTAVHVGLRHDAADVVRLDRAAVQDAYAVRGRVAVRLADPVPERRADLLRVLRGRHLAGADRPDRLVRDDQPRDLLGREGRQRPVDLVEAVPDVLTGLPDLQPLAHAHDRRH